MGLLNIVSLTKNIEEIRILLADQCLHIPALNETQLDESIHNDAIYIYIYIYIWGYDLIRSDRSRTGGGVCLYVRQPLNYQNRQDLIMHSLEGSCIEVHKPNSSPYCNSLQASKCNSGDIR